MQHQEHSQKQKKQGNVTKNNNSRRYKSLKNLIFINLTYNVGNIFFGYALVYLHRINFQTIDKVYDTPLDQSIARGILAGFIPIGAFFGCIFTKKLLQKISRRHTYLIANILAIIFTLLLFIPNFYMFIIMRLGQGFSVGIISTLIPILTKQINPVQMIGSFGFLHSFFLSLGVFFTFLLAFILTHATHNYEGQHIWIYIFGYPIIVIIIQSIVLIFYYDFQTPKYYIINRQYGEAKDLIQYIYKPQYVEQVYKQKLINCHIIVPSLQNQQNHNTTATTDLTFANINPEFNNGIGTKSRSRKYQIKSPNIAIFIAYQLGVLQQFSGINAVVVYGIQNISQVYPKLNEIFPIIINLQLTAFSLLFPLLSKRFGSRPIILYGCIISMIGTLFMGIGFSVLRTNAQAAIGLVLTGKLLFMANFALSVGPVTFILITQIVQPRYVTHSISIHWIVLFIVVFLFPILTKHLFGNNPGPLFYFFTVWVFFSIIINYKYTIQTKNKTQQQIRNEYQNFCQKC